MGTVHNIFFKKAKKQHPIFSSGAVIYAVCGQKSFTMSRLLTTMAVSFVLEGYPVFESILLICFFTQSVVTPNSSAIYL